MIASEEGPEVKAVGKNWPAEILYYVQHRVNPNVNCGLWEIMICHCRLISCNKCTLWWWILIIGETMHVWGAGAYGKSLYLHLNFALNQKGLLKNRLKKKISSSYPNEMWLSRMYSGTDKEHLKKNWWNLNKVWSLVNGNEPTLVS